LCVKEKKEKGTYQNPIKENRVNDRPNNLAPIALFTYNRPDLALKTLKSLKNCELSGQSELYIFSDGPKPNATRKDIGKIQEVRDVIESGQWCGNVHIIKHEKNIGLRGSIVGGVNKVLERQEKIIVLEDDLLLSPGFLKYMNRALDVYEENEKVMHIAGYLFPLEEEFP